MTLNGIGLAAQGTIAARLPGSWQAGPLASARSPQAFASSFSPAANRPWYRLNRDLLAFRQAVDELASPRLWQAKVTSSSVPAAVVATASPGAPVGRYEVTVRALAQAETFASTSFSGRYTALGLTGAFKLGGQEIKVDAGDTLESLAAKLDKTGLVDAKVEETGGGFRLSLTSTETGLAGVRSLADLDSAGAATQLGLLDAEGRKAAVVQVARDASFALGSRELSAGTNRPTVDGITFELKQPTEAPVTVLVQHDDEAVVAAARNVVERYTQALSGLARLTGSGSGGGGSASSGAETVRLQRQLVAALQGTSPVSTEEPPRLTELGFRFDLGGRLTLDEAAFRAKLSADRDTAERALAGESGLGQRIGTVLAPLTSGNAAEETGAPGAWINREAFRVLTGGTSVREMSLQAQADLLERSLSSLTQAQTSFAQLLGYLS